MDELKAYRPNSNLSKEKQEVAKPTIEKVTKRPVKVKKKNASTKLADVFISEDVHNVKSYVLMDVLVPAIKKAISDIVTNGIDMILYGETGRSSKRSGSASKVSYSKYYDRDDRKEYNHRPRVGYSYDDIIFESRGEAEEVRDRMDEIISQYGMASVSDLCDLAGVTANYTDNKYGWTDIRNADIHRVRDGYIIRFPKAMPIG